METINLDELREFAQKESVNIYYNTGINPTAVEAIIVASIMKWNELKKPTVSSNK